MVRKTIYGSLVLVLIASIFFGTSVSHGPPKHSAAEFEIKALQDYASGNKELFLKMTSVDNASFVSATKPKGEIWKYNDKGELLDPWGKPYIVTRTRPVQQALFVPEMVEQRVAQSTMKIHAMTTAPDLNRIHHSRPTAHTPRPLPVWLQVGIVVLVLVQGVQTAAHWYHAATSQVSSVTATQEKGDRYN